MAKLEKTVNDFMGAWRKKDFSKMQNLLQKTYLDGSQPVDLPTVFGNVDIKTWKIVKSLRIGQACRDMIVNVIFGQNGITNKRKLNIRVICETAPYIPDLSGSWGVNPISVMRRL